MIIKNTSKATVIILVLPTVPKHYRMSVLNTVCSERDTRH